MDHIHLALVVSRGCILARIGPVASAANTFTLPPTSDGRMAMVKNTIPKPPIHCISERQNSMPWGKVSRSSMMLAPVVVKPDMVSKYASVMLLMEPWIRNGNIPKKENTAQAAVTSTKASRRLRMFSALRPNERKSRAPPMVIITESRKASTSSSPDHRARARHQDMKNASIKSREPRIVQMIRKLTMLGDGC